MLALMRQNIVLNNLNNKVVAEVLDWGNPISSTLPKLPDIILAAQ